MILKIAHSERENPEEYRSDQADQGANDWEVSQRCHLMDALQCPEDRNCLRNEDAHRSLDCRSWPRGVCCQTSHSEVALPTDPSSDQAYNDSLTRAYYILCMGFPDVQHLSQTGTCSTVKPSIVSLYTPLIPCTARNYLSATPPYTPRTLCGGVAHSEIPW